MTKKESAKSEISKVNNYIYLGPASHPLENSDEFCNLKVDVVINCAKEIKYPDNSKVIVEHFPIVDGDSISFLENMDQAISRIRYYLSHGKKIYLHCNLGRSRSPAILIYYLMVQKKFTYDNALELLEKIRPEISIHFEFENSLRVIEEQ